MIAPYGSISFITKYSGLDNLLRVFHFNVRSINRNPDKLHLQLHPLPVELHILVLISTKRRGPGDWLGVPGYTADHSIRTDKRGAAVSVLVKSHLKFEVLQRFTVVTDIIELCSVCVTFETKRYYSLGFYRPKCLYF